MQNGRRRHGRGQPLPHFILDSAFCILPLIRMGLIKSQDAPPTLSAFSMKDVEQQARALLLAARRKAEQLLVAAQEEGGQIGAQGKTEGFEEGRRAAWEE